MQLAHYFSPNRIRPERMWLVCLILLSVVIYAPTLKGNFVYDDVLFVQDGMLRRVSYLWETWWNPSLQSHTQFPHYRPLTFFTFSLNFLLLGEAPWSFHAFSIAANALATALVYVLSRRLFSDVTLAGFIALLFTLMPVHSEAVAYVKARDEILVAIFFLCAWIFFMNAVASGRRRFAVVAAFFSLCAFLSKESALIIPGVLGSWVFLAHGWKHAVRQWLPVGLQAIAIAVYFALHSHATNGPAIPVSETLYFGQNPLGYMAAEFVPWTAAMLLFQAVAITLVPWNLSATYGYAHLPPVDSVTGHPFAVLGLLLLLLLVAMALHKQTRAAPPGIGAMTFLILYFPFSKIPFVHGIDYFAERWLYAPSIGISFISGYAACSAWKRWNVRMLPVFAGILMWYAFVIGMRTADWKDAASLGSSMLRSAPRSVIANEYMARELFQQGRTPEASMLVGQGLAVTRRHIPLHYLAAEIALDMNMPETAADAIDAVEALGEHEYYTSILRSTILAKQKRYEESLANLEQQEEFDPFERRTRFLLALNLWHLGKYEEAGYYFDWDANQKHNRLSRDQKIWIIENF